MAKKKAPKLICKTPWLKKREGGDWGYRQLKLCGGYIPKWFNVPKSTKRLRVLLYDAEPDGGDAKYIKLAISMGGCSKNRCARWTTNRRAKDEYSSSWAGFDMGMCKFVVEQVFGNKPYSATREGWIEVEVED